MFKKMVLFVSSKINMYLCTVPLTQEGMDNSYNN